MKPIIGITTPKEQTLGERLSEPRIIASFVAGGTFLIVVFILGFQRCGRKSSPKVVMQDAGTGTPKASRDVEDVFDDDGMNDASPPVSTSDSEAAPEVKKKYDLSFPTNIFSAVQAGKYPKKVDDEEDETSKVDEESPATPDLNNAVENAFEDDPPTSAPVVEKKYDLSLPTGIFSAVQAGKYPKKVEEESDDDDEEEESSEEVDEESSQDEESSESVEKDSPTTPVVDDINEDPSDSGEEKKHDLSFPTGIFSAVQAGNYPKKVEEESPKEDEELSKVEEGILIDTLLIPPSPLVTTHDEEDEEGEDDEEKTIPSVQISALDDHISYAKEGEDDEEKDSLISEDEIKEENVEVFVINDKGDKDSWKLDGDAFSDNLEKAKEEERLR